MMRNTIVRTMATSTIKAFKLSMEDGKPVVKDLPEIITTGKAKEKDALKVLKKEYGDLTGITIGEIKIEEASYEISVEDFMKYAKKVGTETEETATAEAEAEANTKTEKEGK